MRELIFSLIVGFGIFLIILGGSYRGDMAPWEIEEYVERNSKDG